MHETHMWTTLPLIRRGLLCLQDKAMQTSRSNVEDFARFCKSENKSWKARLLKAHLVAPA